MKPWISNNFKENTISIFLIILLLIFTNHFIKADQDASSSIEGRTAVEAKGTSIKKFGAKGDGISDDTSAIRAAFNSDEGNLHFPKGVYKVTSPIVVNPGKQRRVTGESDVVISAYLTANQSLFNLRRNMSFKNIEFDFNKGSLQYGLFYKEDLGEISLENIKFRNVRDVNSTLGTIGIYVAANGTQLTAENILFENFYKMGNGIIGDGGGNLTCVYIRNSIENSDISTHLKGIRIFNTHNINENNELLVEDVSGIYILDKGKPENNKILIEDISGHNFGKRLIKLQASNTEVKKVVAFSDTSDSATAISILADPQSSEMNINNTVTDMKVEGTFNVALSSSSTNTTFKNIDIDIQKPNLAGNPPIAYGVRVAGGNTLVENGTIKAEIPLENLSSYGGELQVKNVQVIATSPPIEAIPKSTERISGKNRYETAIAISKEGWDSTDTVVLATAGDFPDALTGGPLAYQEDAPILLTRTKSLNAETKQEIKRLGAKKVMILGSNNAVSMEVEAELKSMGLSIERLGGKTRFETAALIAGKMSSDRAVVANGLNFPDVLSVSSYAAKNGVPILLTRKDSLPDETKVALNGMSSTYVIGSTSVVSKFVYDGLPKPTRYGGKDRYETGYEVATKLTMSTHKAFIATGSNFPDALAGSVLAAKYDGPILLVHPTSIPDATNNQLPSYEGFSIFGGTDAVHGSVKDSLDEALRK